LLNLRRAKQCLHRARKLRHESITGFAEDAPAMRGHNGVHSLPVRFERAVGSLLVLFHVTGVTSDVGADDSGQPAFDRLRLHSIPTLAPRKGPHRTSRSE